MDGDRRIAVIGVMGSGSDAHTSRARALGRWLAQRGANLLTGGGGGVMAAVSQAFCEVQPRRGLCVGVLPAIAEDDATPPAGYPNPWVELVIRTHLPLRGERGAETLSRNHINVLSSDVVVLLAGGAGTRSEAELALRYKRPVVAFIGDARELPGLPESIPIAQELARLAALVDDCL